MIIPYRLLTPTAKAPTKAHEHDAAFDIYADNTRAIELGPLARPISTGLVLLIPEGYCGVLKGRSGLAKNRSVEILGGVIDSGYTGEIQVIMRSEEMGVEIICGKRIAQLLILPVPAVEFQQVESLDATARGEKGFGSSGL